MKLTRKFPMNETDKKLTAVFQELGSLQRSMGEILEEYECDDEDEDMLELLTDALDAIDDAYDCLSDIIRG